MWRKQILDQASCSTDLRAENQDEAIRGIAALLVKNPLARDVPIQVMTDRLTEREKLEPTDVGSGVAIPHCKVDSLEGFTVALAVCRRGVKWNSMDGRNVHIICGIAGPKGASDDHLRILAGVARVLRAEKARHEILGSDTPLAMKEAFLRHLAPLPPRPADDKRDRKKLLIMVLQEEEAYNQVMELFLEEGVEGAVTLHASMMGPVLSGVPIFAGFMDVLGRSRPEPRVLLTLIPEDRVDGIVSEVEGITGNLDTHRGACILVMDPCTVYGSLETL